MKTETYITAQAAAVSGSADADAGVGLGAWNVRAASPTYAA